jgi:hypothetical protein
LFAHDKARVPAQIWKVRQDMLRPHGNRIPMEIMGQCDYADPEFPILKLNRRGDAKFHSRMDEGTGTGSAKFITKCGVRA